MARSFKPPWRVEKVPGGYVVQDADGQALAYVYGRERQTDTDTAKVLTMDAARRVATKRKAPDEVAGAEQMRELARLSSHATP